MLEDTIANVVRRAGLGPALLLAGLSAAHAAGQPGPLGQSGGLFQPAEAAVASLAARGPAAGLSDTLAVRQRLVAIDFGQLAPSAAAPASSARAVAQPGMLVLNLFDDAVFTGLVQHVAPTFSGGYSLSGPLAGVEFGTMTVVVNGGVVAGSVRTPDATFRIRPAGDGLHVVSEVDLSRLPPLGEPIVPPRYDERPPFGPDDGRPGRR